MMSLTAMTVRRLQEYLAHYTRQATTAGLTPHQAAAKWRMVAAYQAELDARAAAVELDARTAVQ